MAPRSGLWKPMLNMFIAAIVKDLHDAGYNNSTYNPDAYEALVRFVYDRTAPRNNGGADQRSVAGRTRKTRKPPTRDAGQSIPEASARSGSETESHENTKGAASNGQ